MHMVSFFKKASFFIVLTLAVLAAPSAAFSFEVPYEDSRIRYFYVFGPEGNPKSGAQDSTQALYVDVPKGGDDYVSISVYDPNTGGKKDWRSSSDNPWDTVTEFSVYGDKLLEQEKFGEATYERQYFVFGPYQKDLGEEFNTFYRFRLVAKALSGDDANLYKVNIFPENAQAFSYDLTFRLLPHKGDKMYLYPEVSKSIKKIIVENYDLDQHGGSSVLYDAYSNIHYKINDSKSAEWARTEIPLVPKERHRLNYIITKAIQRNAHAGLRVKDEKGNQLPIYFKKDGPIYLPGTKPMPKPVPKPKPPKLKPCPENNKFIFDGTRSCDPDNQKLSFFWEFGDGTTGQGPVVPHTYREAGKYNVTLTVKDDSGLECDTAVEQTVVIARTQPIAAFSMPEKACVGDSLILDASATKGSAPETLTYNWYFGDGTKATGRMVEKTFTKGGNYKVKLLVDDNGGTVCSTDIIEKHIRVNTPPIADAGQDIQSCIPYGNDCKVAFYASGSKDPDGDELSYKWDFGDGTGGSGRRVSHTYEKGGVYAARLTVNDGSGTGCSSSVANVGVNLAKTPLAVAGRDIKACPGAEALFDASGSRGEEGVELAYRWDFGDGSSGVGKQVKHTYKKGGNYKAVLTVDDRRGTPCSLSIANLSVSVNSKPKADLKKVGRTCVGETIVFDASDSKDPDGTPLNYIWDFGDGVVIGGNAKAKHTYAKGGSYTVKVSVDDGSNSVCSSDYAAVTVLVNTPPVADAGPNLVCCVNQRSPFDASGSSDADNDKLSYYWDFGDGEKGQGKKVSHVYRQPGKYTVTLKVDDNSKTPCSSATDSFNVTVNASPDAVIDVK